MFLKRVQVMFLIILSKALLFFNIYKNNYEILLSEKKLLTKQKLPQLVKIIVLIIKSF